MDKEQNKDKWQGDYGANVPENPGARLDAAGKDFKHPVIEAPDRDQTEHDQRASECQSDVDQILPQNAPLLKPPGTVENHLNRLKDSETGEDEQGEGDDRRLPTWALRNPVEAPEYLSGVLWNE